MAVTRAEYLLRSALRACRNGRMLSGWLVSGGYIAGLSKAGTTIRWMVFGGLEDMADWRRLSIAKNRGSLDGAMGMKFMVEMEGWVRRFVRSKA